MSQHPAIDRALERLHEALTPYVQRAMEAAFGDDWRRQAEAGLHDPYLPQKPWDVHALLVIMHNNWNAAFHADLGEAGRLLVGELRTRPPQGNLAPPDAFRALDTVARLLRAVGDEDAAAAVQQDAFALMQAQFQPPTPPAASDPAQDEEAVSEAPAQDEAAEPHDETVGTTDEAEAPREATGMVEAETSEDVGTPAQDEAEEVEAPAPDEAENADAPSGEEKEEEAEEAGGRRGWLGRLLHRADEQDLEPLELRTRLLDKVEHALRRFRGQRPLPFNEITVHILAPHSADRFAYETAIDDLSPPFQQDALHRLGVAGYGVPEVLRVKTKIYTRAPKKLQDEFEGGGPIFVDLKQHAARTSATLTILKGKAEQPSYRLRSDDRLNIGRLREVEEDRYGHLVRHNHIAFLDHTDPAVDAEDRAVNETVSRRHARIEHDARTGAFVLVNEQGVTTISRAGLPRPVQVRHQTVVLQDGDLINLGRACLRFSSGRR